MSEKDDIITSIICSEQDGMDTCQYQEFYYDVRYEQWDEYTLEELQEWCDDDDPDREDLWKRKTY